MNSNYLSKDDYLRKTKEIFKLLNEFRKNPRTLSKHLENLKKYLDRKTNVLSEPNKIQVQMVEGEAVFNEAINFLNSITHLDALILDDRLCRSAMEHVLDIGPKGLLSYQSSDGTEPEERISKFGNYIESLGENIDFGPNDAMGVLISLTLDDGENDRPHRENLFKSEYKKIGIACGPHKTEYQMCVMDFAFDFLPLDSETDGGSKNTSKGNNLGKNNTPSYNDEKSNFIGKQNNTNNTGTGNSDKYNDNNPLVKVSLDRNEYNNPSFGNTNIHADNLDNEIRYLNQEKKCIKKLVEVTTKIVYKFEDGSTREITEKKQNIFNN